MLEASRTYFKMLSRTGKENLDLFMFPLMKSSVTLKMMLNNYFMKNFPISRPYSASKASSDHLVRAWNRTFELPTVITNCTNNYGPFQHIEKLIPKTITNAIRHKKIPIYGSGEQIRDCYM